MTDPSVTEQWQAAYLPSFVTVSKTKHVYVFSYLIASIKQRKKGKKKKKITDTYVLKLLRNNFYHCQLYKK